MVARGHSLDMKHLSIGVKKFNISFPVACRQTTAGDIAAALSPDDNVEYFTTTAIYGKGKHFLPPGLKELEINDLYPPNIAVLDYLINHVKEEKRHVILDYACGPGVLLTYLERFKYPAILHGYDNFQQISRKTVNLFLAKRHSKIKIFGPDPSPLHRLKPTIMVSIGMIWNKMKDKHIVLQKKSLKYILTDTRYGPRRIERFSQIAVYDTLLRIFESDG